MKKQTNYERYGNYIINRGQSLGSGTFGKVYKGYQIISENSFGNYERLRLQPIAIKQSYCQASNYQQINILRILTHPNIIKYIDYKVHGNSLFMIMELCQQGTLQDLLMELPQDQNLNDLLILYYSQIVSGIKFMYEKNILHRDIKPSNVLIKDNVVKIADFGTSKLKQGKQFRTLVGTPLFSSPQLLQISLPSEDELDSPIKSTYTERSDIWSLGLVLYMMLNYQRNHDQQGERLRKSLPWSGRHAGEVLKNILTQPLTFKNCKIPENIKQIIKKMLQINPTERMSFKELFEVIEFQTPKVRQVRMNISESNLAISRSFMADQSEQVYDDKIKESIQNSQGHKSLQQIQKKQIDNQLMKLLQIKDSQHYEQDQIKQAIQFYSLLLDGLNGVKQNDQSIDSQLCFLLEKKLYQLQSWRLWHLDYLKKIQMQDSLLKLTNQKLQINNSHNTIMKIDFEMVSQIINQIKGHYSMVQPRLLELNSVINEATFEKIVQKPNTQELLSKQKVILNFIKPDPKLINQIKLYIKTNLNQELTEPFLKNKLKSNMDLTEQLVIKYNKIHLIYDLFTAIEFEYSWKRRGQLSSKYGKKYNLNFMKEGFFGTYKSIRQAVNIKQIIRRIKLAYQSLKISAIKNEQN